MFIVWEKLVGFLTLEGNAASCLHYLLPQVEGIRIGRVLNCLYFFNYLLTVSAQKGMEAAWQKKNVILKLRKRLRHLTKTKRKHKGNGS